MVHRTPTTALILLTLVVMAAPAIADEPTLPEPLPQVDSQWPPCNIWYVTLTFPFVEVHPECI